MRLRALPLLLATLATAGCAGTAPLLPSPTPGTITGAPHPKGQPITGLEQIAWNQQAETSAVIGSYQFSIYVDDDRVDRSGVTCVATSTKTVFDCSRPLPPLTPGHHWLQVSTSLASDPTVESDVSPPLYVFVTGSGTAGLAGARIGSSVVAGGAEGPASTRSGTSVAGSAPGGTRSETIGTSDGVQLRIQTVCEDLDGLKDLAFAPDGRIFLAERSGRIRVVRDGVLQATPAAVLDAGGRAASGRLLGLAIDPQFDRSGLLYAVCVRRSNTETGFAFQVVRFEDSGHGLAGPMILIDGIAASTSAPAASIRFGPDGKLYVALDDGGSGQSAQDLASFNGKVLRLNPDGTTPDDQAAATPVYALGFSSPQGLAWNPGSGTLWVADAPVSGENVLSAVVATDQRPKRATIAARYRLAVPAGVVGLAYYASDRVPAFRGNLFVAEANARDILRLRLDDRSPLEVVATERLLQDRIGNPTLVAVHPDGTIYVGNDTSLMRLVPVPAGPDVGNSAGTIRR